MKFSEVGLGFLLGLLVGIIFSSMNLQLLGARTSKHKGAFFLGVSIKFKTSGDKDAFKTIFGPFAKFVASSEPGTISYELLESDKDPTQVYIAERYKTKLDYLEKHRKTPEFLAFRAKLTDLSATYTMDGHSYLESNLGFV